jgi:hypothetical protein
MAAPLYPRVPDGLWAPRDCAAVSQARLLRQEGGYGLYEVDPGKHDQRVTFFVRSGKH